jgi:hypothetical protein
MIVAPIHIHPHLLSLMRIAIASLRGEELVRQRGGGVECTIIRIRNVLIIIRIIIVLIIV